jgi:hypothetical protein
MQYTGGVYRAIPERGKYLRFVVQTTLNQQNALIRRCPVHWVFLYNAAVELDLQLAMRMAAIVR